MKLTAMLCPLTYALALALGSVDTLWAMGLRYIWRTRSSSVWGEIPADAGAVVGRTLALEESGLLRGVNASEGEIPEEA